MTLVTVVRDGSDVVVVGFAGSDVVTGTDDVVPSTRAWPHAVAATTRTIDPRPTKILALLVVIVPKGYVACG